MIPRVRPFYVTVRSRSGVVVSRFTLCTVSKRMVRLIVCADRPDFWGHSLTIESGKRPGSHMWVRTGHGRVPEGA